MSNTLNNDALKPVYGSYIGNVQGAFLGIGKLMKTGHLDIEEKGQYVKFTSWSKFVPIQEVSISKKDLVQYFTTKKERVLNDVDENKDVVEERVSFIHRVDDSYGFLNRWLGGLTATYYAYQLKYINGELSSFRIQRWNSSNKEKVLYLLEVTNVQKMVEISETETETQKEKVDQRKSDWNF